MTTKTKVYSIKVPFTSHEWRKGSRYVLTLLTTSEVQIVYHTTSKEKDLVYTKTHKILDVKKKVPYIIRKLIPDTACIVDEFSTNIDSAVVTVADSDGNAGTGQAYNITTKMENKEGPVAEIKIEKEGVIKPENLEETLNQLANIEINEKADDKKEGDGTTNIVIENEKGDVLVGEEAKEELGKLMNICTTTYKNRYFDASTFSLEVKTIASKEPTKNAFKLEKLHKEEELDFRTYNHASLLRVGSRDYSGHWEERYPSLIVYKCIDVSVNSFGLGWITAEVDKMLRNLLVSVQQKIIETYDEWSKLTEEQLVELEEQMVERFIVKIDQE